MGLCPSKSRLPLLEIHTELYLSLTASLFPSPPPPAAEAASPLPREPSRHSGTAREPSRHSGAAAGRVHGYAKLQRLGRGRSAKVRLCSRVVDGELFAMKVFNKSLLRRQRQWDEASGAYQNALEGVAREIAILKKLRHPNVVRLHEVIDDPVKDKLYLILDYVPGGPLMGGARYQQSYEEERARCLFRDIVCGLAYLHFQGVIHQDLKPENILLSAAGRALIADLGVARVLRTSRLCAHHEPADEADDALAAAAAPEEERTLDDEDAWMQSPWAALGSPQSTRMLESSEGTPAFRAPETWAEGLHCGRAADVWSLGATLYTMLFGQVPFAADTEAGIQRAICEGSLEWPQHPPVSALAKELLQLLLEKRPDRRAGLQQAARHDWVTKGGTDPLDPYFGKRRVGATSEDCHRAISRRSAKLEGLDLAGDEGTSSARVQQQNAHLRRHKSEACPASSGQQLAAC
ncbi:hypothetical protein AB1Y20_014334 [Prymnesium parvum]|uniref:Protein kinase domain-containing protein n=1 Tax=Prymnesium parvum TaxID=97485 RepID=A0AB34IHC3_PRYPA